MFTMTPFVIVMVYLVEWSKNKGPLTLEYHRLYLHSHFKNKLVSVKLN